MRLVLTLMLLIASASGAFCYELDMGGLPNGVYRELELVPMVRNTHKLRRHVPRARHRARRVVHVQPDKSYTPIVLSGLADTPLQAPSRATNQDIEFAHNQFKLVPFKPMIGRTMHAAAPLIPYWYGFGILAILALGYVGYWITDIQFPDDEP